MPISKVTYHHGQTWNTLYGTFNQLSDALYAYTGVASILVKDDNTYYKSIDGCLYSKDGTTLYSVPPKYEGDLIIADGTTTIASGSFYPYSTFTYSVHTKVTSLYIPASVKSISSYPLTWINKLPSSCTITVSEDNPYWQVNDSGKVEQKTSTASVLSMPALILRSLLNNKRSLK